jgi:hypothetical protein
MHRNLVHEVSDSKKTAGYYYRKTGRFYGRLSYTYNANNAPIWYISNEYVIVQGYGCDRDWEIPYH